LGRELLTENGEWVKEQDYRDFYFLAKCIIDFAEVLMTELN
jgi:hypothetical protein